MDLQTIASQLRKPEGEAGKQIGQVMNNGNKLINEWAIEALNLKENDALLEIGMGNGFFVKEILSTQSSPHYTGIDYSEIMVKEANILNEHFISEGKVRFVFGTADQLPFMENSFSKILAVNTIYFWNDCANELAEIKRVLKPGGIFSIGIRSKEAMQQMPFTEFGFTKYNREELIQLLRNNRFKILNVIEKKEPPYDFNGETVQLENIIVTASK